MLTDYSELEQEIADAPELTILPAGTEVKARVINVRTGVSDKNDCSWFMPTFDIPSEPTALEFNDFFWDLADRDKLDDKAKIRAMRKFKVFADAFGLDYSRPFDIEEDLVGLEGWLILGVRKDEEYGTQNTVKSYIDGK